VRSHVFFRSLQERARILPLLGDFPGLDDFSGRLVRHAKRQHSIVFSAEVFSKLSGEEDWHDKVLVLLKSMLEGWDARIVITYRNFPDYITSASSAWELSSMGLVLTNRWMVSSVVRCRSSLEGTEAGGFSRECTL